MRPQLRDTLSYGLALSSLEKALCWQMALAPRRHLYKLLFSMIHYIFYYILLYYYNYIIIFKSL